MTSDVQFAPANDLHHPNDSSHAREGSTPPDPTKFAEPSRGTPLRVLIVEDLEDDALLMVRELTRGGYAVDFLRVENPDAMTAALQARSWDLILSDHSMPKFNAPAALALVKRHKLDLPFIIVSGSIGEDQAVAVMKAGASDYFRKDALSRLSPAVERELREAEIRRARKAAESALAKSEALYRTLVQTSPDAIVVTDLDSRIRMANPQAQALLGWTRMEDMTGTRWLDSFGAAPKPILRALEKARRKETVTLDELAVSRPGRTAPVLTEFSAAPLLDDRGRPESILFDLRDITSRKQAEEQIRSQFDRLAALRTVDAAITASLDLRVTLMVILDALTTQLRVDAADIYLLRPHSQTLHYAGGRGFRSVVPRDGYLPLNRGHTGRVAVERRILSIPRLAEQEDEHERMATLRQEGFISYIAAPLISKNQTKGVVEIFHRAPLDPGPDWLSFLETLAEQAAIAIDNAAMYEDLQRTNVELTIAYDATIEGWSHALDLRDRETEGHTRRVTEATLRLAHIMGIPEGERIHIRRGCLLHDIGKMAIPDKILLKPGPLNDEEWTVMRRHPVSAFEFLSPISFLRPALEIPYCHHERFNGGGYPRGLTAEQIPLSARVFAVVDVWDALRSDRPYRAAWPEEKVLEYMRSHSGKSFDPVVLRAFVEMARYAEAPARSSTRRLGNPKAPA